MDILNPVYVDEEEKTRVYGLALNSLMLKTLKEDTFFHLSFFVLPEE